MRTVPTTPEYFLALAHAVASKSKDPDTQVGAVLVRDGRVIATGYNGFIAGHHEDEELWARPEKYDHVVHAEVNAVAQAARMGHATDGAQLYMTLFPCDSCAKVVLSAGIRHVHARTIRNAEYNLKALARMHASYIAVKIDDQSELDVEARRKVREFYDVFTGGLR